MASHPEASRTIDDVIVLAGRIALGAIFVESGYRQLMTLGAFAASLSSRGLPLPMMWAILGMSAALAGGVLIVIGFRTREASALVLVFMIVASLLSHRYWELADAARRAQQIQFFKNVAIIGGLLLLFVTGSGRVSIDALFRRR
jgi:putative oxidoreductase